MGSLVLVVSLSIRSSLVEAMPKGIASDAFGMPRNDSME
jgi:hypothetical protein